jgi:hypothetical protein
MNVQIKQLQSEILELKLKTPYHPEIRTKQKQLEELYAKSGSPEEDLRYNQ